MGINKNKSYRFRGDSERWVYGNPRHEWICGAFCISNLAAEHLHERGSLLEYPELPGEDWEFCESAEDTGYCVAWSELDGWTSNLANAVIYCRKKNPVITEAECEVMATDRNGPVVFVGGFARPGDKVKVTKL